MRQAKLEVSHPSERRVQEAEQIAQSVMGAPAGMSSLSTSTLQQRAAENNSGKYETIEDQLGQRGAEGSSVTKHVMFARLWNPVLGLILTRENRDKSRSRTIERGTGY